MGWVCLKALLRESVVLIKIKLRRFLRGIETEEKGRYGERPGWALQAETQPSYYTPVYVSGLNPTVMEI